MDSFELRVELGKVREFARATKSANPAYLEGEDPVSPATFLMTSAFWRDEAILPWMEADEHPERILHGEQEFVFHRSPPRAGAVLVGTSRVDRQYHKEGRRAGPMTVTEVVTEFRDAGGVLVAESRSTLLRPEDTERSA